jgi:hypothetical protein
VASVYQGPAIPDRRFCVASGDCVYRSARSIYPADPTGPRRPPTDSPSGPVKISLPHYRQSLAAKPSRIHCCSHNLIPPVDRRCGVRFCRQTLSGWFAQTVGLHRRPLHSRCSAAQATASVQLRRALRWGANVRPSSAHRWLTGRATLTAPFVWLYSEPIGRAHLGPELGRVRRADSRSVRSGRQERGLRCDRDGEARFAGGEARTHSTAGPRGYRPNTAGSAMAFCARCRHALTRVRRWPLAPLRLAAITSPRLSRGRMRGVGATCTAPKTHRTSRKHAAVKNTSFQRSVQFWPA